MSIRVGAIVGLAGILGGAAVSHLAFSVPAGRERLPLWARRPSLGRREWLAFVLGGTLISGYISMILGTFLGWSIVMPAYWLCGLLAVGLAIIDVHVRRLPYAITGVMYASCAVAFGVSAAGSGDARPLVRAVLAAALASMGFLVLALAFPGQLGLGDVVLVGWVAFSLGWFGWRVAVVGLLAGLIIQAAVGILVRVRAGPRRALPMGPALLIGWLVGVLVAAW